MITIKLPQEYNCVSFKEMLKTPGIYGNKLAKDRRYIVTKSNQAFCIFDNDILVCASTYSNNSTESFYKLDEEVIIEFKPKNN